METKGILRFPAARIIDTHPKVSVMEQKLLVITACQVYDMVMSGKEIRVDNAVAKEKRDLAKYHLPDGDLLAIITDATELVVNNHYQQLYDGAEDLAGRCLPVVEGFADSQVQLIIKPTHFKGTGMYRWYIHESLIPDYLALYQYYQTLGGWAFHLHTEYRRRLYYYFSEKDEQGNYIRRDRDDKSYTSVEALAAILQLEGCYKKNGAWVFGAIKNRILCETFDWLRVNTDLDILGCDSRSENPDPWEYKKASTRIMGIYTCARTISGRTPGSPATSRSYIVSIMGIIFRALGLTENEAARITETLTIQEMDGVLLEFNKRYDKAVSKERQIRKLLDEKFPDRALWTAEKTTGISAISALKKTPAL